MLLGAERRRRMKWAERDGFREVWRCVGYVSIFLEFMREVRAPAYAGAWRIRRVRDIISSADTA